jgi:lysophospholipase L1-like esterase
MSKRSKGVDAQKLDPHMELSKGAGGGIQWRSPKQPPFKLAGLAWFARDGVYRRLPVKPKHALRDSVNSLANCTAGAQIRFQTNSSRLSLRVKLRGPATMDHMPATGQCCFDLYVGPIGKMTYFSTGRYDRTLSEYETTLFQDLPAERRDLTLDFPLYQGVVDVQVGLDAGARIWPPRPYADKRRAIFYGTSITQGGCAARAGMAYTNILSRRFNMECINLGFSGNGKGEPELARLILEIERPALYVLDYDANVGDVEMRKTLPEFIRILRAERPTTPILVVSRPPTAPELVRPGARKARCAKAAFQRAEVARWRREGDKNIYFLNGGDLMGKDFHECTVDGGHPTDLGFMRMADAMTPVLRGILK